MAVRKLKDDEGNSYDVEIPDKDDDGGDDDGDGDTIYLDEEDIEWLRRKRREESEASRTSGTTKQTKTGSSDRVIKIRAKQQSPSTGSQSKTTRKRTLRLA
jgi:hypothetical protein